MGLIAALLSRTESDVSAHLLRMLRSASPGRGDGYGVATPEGARTYTSLPVSLDFGSGVMLGHKLIKVMPNDPPQPVIQHGHAMIFEGRLWGSPAPSDISAAADLVGPDPARGIRQLVAEENGSYVAAAAERGRILCGRDPVGVVPVYFGETEALVGVASNRKMLWSVGVEVEPLPPGCIAEITKGGVRLHRVRRLRQPPVRSVSMEEAVEELDALLREAVEARCRGVFSASLGFSGGIDSSLLAHYLDRCGVKVDLVCVGLEGSAEFEAADSAAESLGLPIRIESFSPKDVGEDLDAVLRSVEEPDPMKVSVALPLYWAVRSVARRGGRVFYSGNGSDELFGGYLRYVREYASSGEAAREAMFRDVAAAHEVNYERDHKVCADAEVELRLLFADLRLIEFGLSLPVGLKLSAEMGAPRKLLLRTLARRIGLSDAIASRRKRAVQYSTGVSRALKRLAKGDGTTLARYLAERFERVKERYLDGRATSER
ncbi:MAG: asparagine synthase-related protein [Candidatus Bathyarchaeia archaeon]